MKIIRTSSFDMESLIQELNRVRDGRLSPDYMEHLRKTKNPDQIKQLIADAVAEKNDPREQARQQMYQREQARQQAHQQWLQTLPEDLRQISPKPAEDVYTRYVWAEKKDLSAKLKSGLEMNYGHDALPEGWHYIHVGDEQWVSLLGFEYNRSGKVCELTISDLPDGFYEVEDLDLQFPGKSPQSGMLISKMQLIPPECIKVTRCFSTERMMRQFPQYGREGFYESA